MPFWSLSRDYNENMTVGEWARELVAGKTPANEVYEMSDVKILAESEVEGTVRVMRMFRAVDEEEVMRGSEQDGDGVWLSRRDVEDAVNFVREGVVEVRRIEDFQWISFREEDLRQEILRGFRVLEDVQERNARDQIEDEE